MHNLRRSGHQFYKFTDLPTSNCTIGVDWFKQSCHALCLRSSDHSSGKFIDPPTSTCTSGLDWFKHAVVPASSFIDAVVSAFAFIDAVVPAFSFIDAVEPAFTFYSGVSQTNERISAASGPKLTILWGHVEEILLLNKFFFRLSIHALVAKI